MLQQRTPVNVMEGDSDSALVAVVDGGAARIFHKLFGRLEVWSKTLVNQAEARYHTLHTMFVNIAVAGVSIFQLRLVASVDDLPFSLPFVFFFHHVSYSRIRLRLDTVLSEPPNLIYGRKLNVTIELLCVLPIALTPSRKHRRNSHIAFVRGKTADGDGAAGTRFFVEGYRNPQPGEVRIAQRDARTGPLWLTIHAHLFCIFWWENESTADEQGGNVSELERERGGGGADILAGLVNGAVFAVV